MHCKFCALCIVNFYGVHYKFVMCIAYCTLYSVYYELCMVCIVHCAFCIVHCINGVLCIVHNEWIHAHYSDLTSPWYRKLLKFLWKMQSRNFGKLCLFACYKLSKTDRNHCFVEILVLEFF